MVNARAGRLRRDPQLADRLRALVPRENVRLTEAVDEVESALSELRDAGIETLVVVGGDGTVGGTLTPLIHSWPAATLPRVVLTRGGTVNTIPRALGGRGTPERVVAELMAEDVALYETLRPALRITADQGAPRYGMIFGNGMVPRWLGHYYADSRHGIRGALATVARSLASVAVNGPLAREVFAHFEASVELDAEPPVTRRFTGMAGATVRDIGLGFRPFRSAGESPERFHWLSTDAGGRRFGSELPALRLGIVRGSCLEHASPRRAHVRTERPVAWMIDADLFPPASELLVETGPVLRFATPGGHQPRG